MSVAQDVFRIIETLSDGCQDCQRAISNGQGRVHCPSHDDGDPSLNVSVSNGKLLVHCHAGCHQQAVVLELRKMGLWPSGNGTVTTTYDYRDMSGEVLYQAVRTEVPGKPKKFQQRRPDGHGGWVWSVSDTDKVLYRLPELLAADPSEWVFVVEGEGKADRLASLGLVATTNVGGAGKGKWLRGYNATLSRRNVVLLPDNDDAGRGHMDVIEHGLVRLASTLVKVDLAEHEPALPKKGDILDWLELEHTTGELLDLVAAAPPITPETTARAKAATSQKLEDPPPAAAAESGERFTLTDTGNGERLVDRHGVDLHYYAERERWLVWDGRRWSNTHHASVEALAKETVVALLKHANATHNDSLAKHALKTLGTRNLAAMIHAARSEFGMLVTADQLDTDPLLLNVLNGTLDLRTGKLLKHDRQRLLTRLAPVVYDPRAQAPRFMQFLAEVFKDRPEVAEHVQRACGYSLTADASERKVFLLKGDGSNGKSVLLDVIRGILGDYARSVPTETLMQKWQVGGHIPNDIAALHGARFVTAIEADEDRRLAESVIKAMSGGTDRIPVRFLHAEFFDMLPVYKLWIASNHLPTIRGQDQAIWDRINLIEFDERFEGLGQDKKLPAQLRAEWPGILVWMVRGCMAWQRDGLLPPQRITDSTNRYRQDMDVVGRFLDEYFDAAPGSYVEFRDLYSLYTLWCGTYHEQPLSANMVGRRLTDKGYREDRQRGERVRWGLKRRQ